MQRKSSHKCSGNIWKPSMKFVSSLPGIRNFPAGSLNTIRERIERSRGLIFGIAATAFAIGLILSVRENPEIFNSLNFGYISLLVFIGVPATVFISTLEFLISGRILGVKLGLLYSLKVTILGAVANMLPIPGALIVRIGALKKGGASVTDGTIVTLIVTIAWIGTAFVLAGISTLILDRYFYAITFSIIAAISFLLCTVIAHLRYQLDRSLVYLLITRLALVITDTVRIYLCFASLGIDVQLPQAAVFPIAAVMGGIVTIVPAGLGIREGMSAVLGTIVGLDPSASFLAASLNRMAGMVLIIAIAIGLTVRERQKERH